MALKDLTREGVLEAIDEFDRIGRDAFLRRYGFGQSRRYFIALGGRLYDSKAVAGAAHAYSAGRPLRHIEFSGGEATVGPALERLGFDLTAIASPPSEEEWREAFWVGEHYTRDQIAELIGFPTEKRDGGDFTTGYFKHGKSFFLFCNIGSAGRTGHDYPNQWQGLDLVWSAKSNTHLDQPRIREMVSGDFDVLVFWRARDRAPFTYAGLAYAVEVDDTTPVRVAWSFEAPAASNISSDKSDDAPAFKRGPRPFKGERLARVVDGETSVYLMTLQGAGRELFPDSPEDSVIIKVGLSNDPERRLREMNSGFPPRSLISWAVKETRLHANSDTAFQAETLLLEALRERKFWIGGEFAIVPSSDLSGIIQLMMKEA